MTSAATGPEAAHIDAIAKRIGDLSIAASEVSPASAFSSDLEPISGGGIVQNLEHRPQQNWDMVVL
jgi:hypothetical protein